MFKRTFVNVGALKSGMRIDQSIVDQSRRALIVRGTILDDYLITGLKKLGISGVYVSEGEYEEKVAEKVEEIKIAPQTVKLIENISVADRAKVKLTESVKKRVEQGIQFVFYNTESEGFIEATNKITEDLMKAIIENDAVAVDVDMLKVSDEYTFKHSVDVATIAMIIARKHGLNENQVYEIGIAGLLHDVGKSKIPTEILNKPARLTDDEFAIMRNHSVLGYELIKGKKELSDNVKLGVLQHHEKVNGRGYPLGVTAEKISLYAKILAVADVYDALVTERPYKAAFTKRDAVEMLMAMTAELDIDVMKSFLESVILYPVGSNVTLSNGEVARVVENDPTCILRPKVVTLSGGKVYDLANDLACANIIIL